MSFIEGKFKRPIRCFIAEPLRNLRDWSITNRHEICCDEPKHPHTNIYLAEQLRLCGTQVSFSNEIKRSQLYSFLVNQLNSPIKEVFNGFSAFSYDVVIAYSQIGAILTNLSTFKLGKKPTIVLMILSYINPNGPKWKTSLRRLTIEKAVKKADTVVFGLRELAENFVRNGSLDHEKVFYAPTGVDTEFYDCGLVESVDGIDELSGKPFILSVGDSSRDDEFLYDALSEVSTPIVRVTRDKTVISKVQGLLNKQRGDLILTAISFRQLRWLYSHCSVFIIASKLNAWQAAGSTALAEAMACSAICICNGGGCIEKEWHSLAADANIECPVRFYQPLNAHSLLTVLDGTLKLTAEAKKKLGIDSRKTATRAFPISRSYRAIVEAIAHALNMHIEK